MSRINDISDSGSDLLLVYRENLERPENGGRPKSVERSLVLKLGFRHDMLI